LNDSRCINGRAAIEATLMDIRVISLEGEAVSAFLAQATAYAANLYPSESNHLDGAAELSKPNVRFLGAFIGNELAGIGAVKVLCDDVIYGEIKRVFIAPESRGLGLSKTLMSALEQLLRDDDVLLCRLETGVKQPEAIGLYSKLGYRVREPFGDYRADPLSIFMEKKLDPVA
jgi:putative acetyltransferase